jgi:hypothetical protein
MDQRHSQHADATATGRLGIEEFIIGLFCRVDAAMIGVQRDPRASLYPSELVTLGILYVIKGDRQRAFYRWLDPDWRPWFQRLPERTRLFRNFAIHRSWLKRFLADPTLFGIVDTTGIELLSTRRLGRSVKQIAKRGFCAGRWIAGIKFGLLINAEGQICAWDADTANVYDADGFGHLAAAYQGQMIVLADSTFHRGTSEDFRRRPDPADRDPPNLKICPRGQWNCRRLVETVISMLFGVWSLRRVSERAWPSLKAHLGFVAAAFNLLTSWDGPTELAIARFSL